MSALEPTPPEVIMRYLARDLDRVEERALRARLKKDDALRASLAVASEARADRLGLAALSDPRPELAGCFSTETLQRYVEGRLDPDDAALVQAHAQCPLCGPDIEHLRNRRGPMDRALDAIATGLQRFLDGVRGSLTLQAGLAASAVVLVIGLAGHLVAPAVAPLRIEVLSAGPTVRSVQAFRGDTLAIQTHRSGAEHAVLRVYHERRGLLLECPGAAPACTPTGARILLQDPGMVRVVWLTSERPPAPSEGSFEADVAAHPGDVVVERICVGTR